MELNIESLREYCIAKTGVTEGFPFDKSTLVFKVMGKMFALTDLVGKFSINLKCAPEKAIILREQYSAVIPGYHMDKKHWNTIVVDGSIPTTLILEWLDDSYKLVVSKLTKKQKLELSGL